MAIKNKSIQELRKSYEDKQLAEQLALAIIQNHLDCLNTFLANYRSQRKPDNKVIDIASSVPEQDLIYYIQELLESSMDETSKKENGVVYTHAYIVDYIINKTVDFDKISNLNVVDPACGCGAFLIGFVKNLSKKGKTDVVQYINEHLFGFDLNPNCIEEVELMLNLELLILGYSRFEIKPNIYSFDSLFTDWNEITGKDFDYVIGNPPYVKVQNMNKEYMALLKKSFETTKNGGFNLFYAFIEKSMLHLKNGGKLGFIIPNNFLKIKSGLDLRKFINSNSYLETIVDFDCNMLFAPVMTYNCIVVLSKQENAKFNYGVIDKTNNVAKKLESLTLQSKNRDELDDERWLLLSPLVNKKIKMIERFPNKIGPMIKTGIATLRDKLYIINKFEGGKYYMTVDNVNYQIENELIRPLYKVSDITDVNDIKKDVKYIIFPYEGSPDRPKPIPEDKLKENYPLAYEYFTAIKPLLDERNLIKTSSFFEYGRSQGINNQGRKLMYSQFLGKAKFIYCEDESALICNGFAIYESNVLDIRIIQKVIQSSIMDFYVSSTSYSIDGGFFCYQKKYLKDFSFPTFSKDEIEYLMGETNDKNINKFLENIYFKE